MAKKGLYANIHAKRKRIAAGSGEKMRKVGSKGAPTSKQFKRAAKTAKKKLLWLLRNIKALLAV
jgi:signal recognition particle GTPase